MHIYNGMLLICGANIIALKSPSCLNIELREPKATLTTCFGGFSLKKSFHTKI